MHLIKPSVIAGLCATLGSCTMGHTAQAQLSDSDRQAFLAGALSSAEKNLIYRHNALNMLRPFDSLDNGHLRQSLAKSYDFYQQQMALMRQHNDLDHTVMTHCFTTAAGREIETSLTLQKYGMTAIYRHVGSLDEDVVAYSYGFDGDYPIGASVTKTRHDANKVMVWTEQSFQADEEKADYYRVRDKVIVQKDDNEMVATADYYGSDKSRYVSLLLRHKNQVFYDRNSQTDLETIGKPHPDLGLFQTQAEAMLGSPASKVERYIALYYAWAR